MKNYNENLEKKLEEIKELLLEEVDIKLSHETLTTLDLKLIAETLANI